MSENTDERTARLPDTPDPVDRFSWRVAAASWVGLLRRNNQDSACSSPRVAGVADGMGGEAAGDLASMVAARRLWMAAANPSVASLVGAVAAASDDIAALVKADKTLEGMGTTICAALFDGHELDIVHIGDSRAYRWRAGKLKQLTHDHSFVQQLIDQGSLTEEQARVHPRRSLVLRVVNGTPIGSPDHFTEAPQLGDRYLFCSDGLSGYVDTAAIRKAIAKPTVDEAVDAMLADASSAGAPDNVTVVCTEIVAQEDELDAARPKLWGAASTMEPPTDNADESDNIVAELAKWGAHIPTEVAPRTPAPRRATQKPTHQATRLRALVAGVVALVVIGAAISGIAWTRTQYFIGVVDGNAAIFKGVPYRIGPWYLNTIEQTSAVAVADLPGYYATQVQAWDIKPPSMQAAQESLQTLQQQADACIAAREGLTPPVEGCP
ncbi:MAG: protein phosphatase 2C domain-containing protein [Propionibacteriaceae bacterium]|nr:protein phosphatase 2C domain-containing protein [Propionibacteriaceae bacterium]